MNLLVDGYLLATLTATFAALKLDGLVSWPWWAVVSPLWIGLILRWFLRNIIKMLKNRFGSYHKNLENLDRDLPLQVWRDIYSLLHERGHTLRDLKASISDQTDPNGTPREGSNWRAALKEDSRISSRSPLIKDDAYKQAMDLGREGSDRYRHSREKLSNKRSNSPIESE